MPFYSSLRIFDCPADHIVLDRLAVRHAQLLHDAGNPFTAENSQQVIFQRQVKAGRTRVSLSAGASPQLIVDPAAFMSLGTHDVQPAEIGDALSQHNVGAAARHIGRNRNRAPLSGHGNDLGFFFMIFRIQHGVLDAPFFQFLAEVFGNIN